MDYKYGKYTQNQIEKTKEYIRKQIYFLLLIVDPKTRNDYAGVNVRQAFDNLLTKLGGMNELLGCSPELVLIMSTLSAALVEYESLDFSYSKYRKLILDAGSEVLNINKEV